METEGYSQEMRSSWNGKARDNAYHWVDSSRSDWGADKSEYYETGKKEVERYFIEPFGQRDISLEGKHLLDIGCGTGRLCRAFSNYCERVDGVDISEEMISLAKKDNADRNNIRFYVGNGVDLSNFQDAQFDIVTSFIVFQHIPSRSVIQSYVNEIFRVLKPGGVTRFQVRGYPGMLKSGLRERQYQGFDRFYVSLYIKFSFIPIVKIRWYDTVFGAFYKSSEIETIVKGVGFKMVTIENSVDDQRYMWITAIK